MDIASILLWIFSVAFVAAGLIGIVLPALPGPPLILVGLILAAWAEGFVYVGWGTIALLTVLAVLAVLLDFLAGSVGTKYFGGGKVAMLGAAIGAIAGLFFGLIGVLVGPFVGAVLGQMFVQKDWEKAGKAGVGAWVGLVVGTVAKIALGFAMIGTFIVARLM